MPIVTWRSYATKIRKKPKSDFNEYTRAEILRLSRKAEHRYSDGQSWEKEKEKKDKEEIDEKIRKEKSFEAHQEGRQRIFSSDQRHQRSDQRGCETEETTSKETKEKKEMKLRPPIEVYEKLDQVIEDHLEGVYHGKETKARLRGEIPSGGSISSEKRSIQSSGSSGSDRKKKVRCKKNG